MKFLDPDKPIATCISETCDNCTVNNALHCHFTLRDLIHFLLIASPSFLLGGAGIYHINGWILLRGATNSLQWAIQFSSLRQLLSQAERDLTEGEDKKRLSFSGTCED